MTTTKWIGAGVLLATLAGCNADGTGPDLTPAADLALSRDIAVQAGEATSEDVELMGGPVGLFGFGFAVAADDHGPFRCNGSHSRQNLTVVRTCTFKDAAGATQSEYDPRTTASATVHVEVSGEISRDSWSASLERVRDLTVSGLAGAETSRTWNGTGSTVASRSRHNDEGETRTFDLTSNGTITNVLVNLPRNENRWPVSGTISRQVTVTITGGKHDGKVISRTATITFNGTQFVPIVVNDQTFTFDLRTRRIVRDD